MNNYAVSYAQNAAGLGSSSNLILKDKILSVDLKESLIPMVEVSKEANEITDRIEPIERVDRTIQLETLFSQSPVLYRVRESNP